MNKIEDTIFDEGLPVNTIAMFHRGIEILNENQCNNPKFLKREAKIQYRKLMWLLCNQVYDFKIDFDDEWTLLRKEQEKKDGNKKVL
jgi:hypothetical protein